MLVILFSQLVCMHIRYLVSSLAVVIFIVTLESKRSPWTDFVAEVMKETIPAILVYIAANF